MPPEALSAWNDAALPLVPWLANYLVHSTLLLAAAWGLARLLRARAHRDLLWRVALVAPLVTASAQAWIGGPLRPTLPRPEAVTAELAPLPATTAAEPGPATTAGLVGSVPAPAPRWRAAGVVTAWVVVAAALLARLALRRRRLHRALAGRTPLPPNAALDRVRAATDLRTLRVTRCAALASPVALGSAEVCVPARWTELDADEQFGMLAHEVAHLLRRDPAWFTLAHVLERVFFFQPLHRVVRRGLQTEAEYLCDAWAAERAGEPLALVRCLSRVAEWIRHAPHHVPPASAVAMAGRRSALVTRVEELLDGRRAPSRSATRALGAALAGSVLLFACAGPGVEQRGAAVHEDDAETPFLAQIPLLGELFESHDTVTIELEPSGVARLEARGTFAQFDVSTPAGRATLRRRLAELAEIADPAADRPAGAFVSSLALEIVCTEDTPYGHVLRVMQQCGQHDVLIADISLRGLGARYEVPLPTDVGVFAGTLPVGIDLRLDAGTDGGARTLTYSMQVGPSAAFPVEEEEVEQGVADEASGEPAAEPLRTGDLAVLRAALAEQHAAHPDARVAVDARPGTVYDDVIALLDAVILAGFTDIVFVGRVD
jgi:beta-lactamase regulating signal transducer with metallopeptidase domain